jgi:hypothetical protein
MFWMVTSRISLPDGLGYEFLVDGPMSEGEARSKAKALSLKDPFTAAKALEMENLSVEERLTDVLKKTHDRRSVAVVLLANKSGAVAA